MRRRRLDVRSVTSDPVFVFVVVTIVLGGGGALLQRCSTGKGSEADDGGGGCLGASRTPETPEPVRKPRATTAATKGKPGEGSAGDRKGGTAAVGAPLDDKGVGEAAVEGPPPDDTLARTLLEALPVGALGAALGDVRDGFGDVWADLDGNGCDQREDALRRDLAEPVLEPGEPGCVVRRGVLSDPYTATGTSYERGREPMVVVDHVVALREAWALGAASWSTARREAFANDPLNLLAVSAEARELRDERDAAGWLPPNEAYRCRYVARQIAVKATYSLPVTAAEKTAMERVLAGCPDEPVPR